MRMTKLNIKDYVYYCEDLNELELIGEDVCKCYWINANEPHKFMYKYLGIEGPFVYELIGEL